MGKRKAATAAGASDDEAPPAEVTVKKEKKAKFEVDDSRTRPLNDVAFEKGGGPVVYWCSRDQRVQDNWALLYAQQEAINRKVPLVVVFNLSPGFLGATLRAYGFMIRGLKEVANDCTKLNIPFVLLRGDCIDTVPTFVRGHNCSLLVSDFSPLRIGREWRTKVAKLILDDGIPHVEVDAHNITPAWICSDKKETGARTIRKKCHNHLAQYLHDFPPVTKHQYTSDSITTTEFEVKEVLESLTEVDRTVPEVKGITPGPAAGLAHLTSFLAKRIKKYAAQRNVPSDPSGVSGLSPWLHYGHLSAQRCILEAQKVRSKANEGVASFIEELYIRRELSDNFCLYEPNYDSLKGCAGWAQETLEVHAKDKREHLYSTKELEECRTHDDMWNAAQREMMATGKMHGYMRMYWAKKILEWTETPTKALETALYLNDKYELDGRDPNGYVGCLWSIGGIHDQGWGERNVFGKIRYMNYAGLLRKQKKEGIAKYVMWSRKVAKEQGYPPVKGKFNAQSK